MTTRLTLLLRRRRFAGAPEKGHEFYPNTVSESTLEVEQSFLRFLTQVGTTGWQCQIAFDIAVEMIVSRGFWRRFSLCRQPVQKDNRRLLSKVWYRDEYASSFLDAFSGDDGRGEEDEAEGEHGLQAALELDQRETDKAATLLSPTLLERLQDELPLPLPEIRVRAGNCVQ
eukprot:scaffold264_cov317-Pinguiococcus_pyrenoidosus.AAC.17